MILKKMLNMFTTNSYILIQDKVAVFIDPVGKIEDFIDILNRNDATLAGIVMTHCHYDHIANLNQLTDHFDVDVYVHSSEVEMLFKPELNLSAHFSRSFTFDKPERVIAVEDNDIMSFEGIELKVIHTPGHTPGCICLLYGKDLFTGDTLFNGSIGRTDFPSSDFNQMKISLKKLKELDKEYKVHPGHGDSSSIGEELKINPYLQEV
ncbi:MBL fold metallo-hydrolase [Alkalibacter mobilis]|uniref:MBL fold metallo-hydrolase n=1 Tax=Alkalibacter mobilis TaxID=2787712 RepID=UPI00189CEC05|nr:MBL fold metallo-hydrolase [Alkalibacter mobilis]MBF7095882.1 MBL fold metallo-hydrolase [Alkalibacter mobilis]